MKPKVEKSIVICDACRRVHVKGTVRKAVTRGLAEVRQGGRGEVRGRKDVCVR